MTTACRARRVLRLAPSLMFLIHLIHSSVYDGATRQDLSDRGFGHIQVMRHGDGNVRISFGLHEYNETALRRFAGVPSRFE